MKRAGFVIGFTLLVGLLGFAHRLSASPGPTDEEIKQACTVDAPKGMVMLPTRMPPIPFDKMTEDQKKVAMDGFTERVADDFHKASKRDVPVVTPPYNVLLRSPEVLLHMKRLNAYLQDHAALPVRLRAFIIVITARQWSVQYTYYNHCPQAAQAGVSLDTIRAIGDGRRPDAMASDEAIVYDFLDELDRNRSVSDATYAKALEKFGEQGIVDMISIHGWYTLFLMNANVARLEWHEGSGGPSLPLFPH